MSPAEQYPKWSYEQQCLREEIDKTIIENPDKIAILQDPNDIETTSEVIMAGRLRADKPGYFVEVELRENCLGEGEFIRTLIISDYIFILNDEGMTLEHAPDYEIDDEYLSDMRVWLKKTVWSNEMAQNIVEYEKQQFDSFN